MSGAVLSLPPYAFMAWRGTLSTLSKLNSNKELASCLINTQTKYFFKLLTVKITLVLFSKRELTKSLFSSGLGKLSQRLKAN
jgi:hypothetical protein